MQVQRAENMYESTIGAWRGKREPRNKEQNSSAPLEDDLSIVLNMDAYYYVCYRYGWTTSAEPDKLHVHVAITVTRCAEYPLSWGFVHAIGTPKRSCTRQTARCVVRCLRVVGR